MSLPDWMRCTDCNQHHAGYMVKKHLWKEAHMPHHAVANGQRVKGGCLCTTCLAKRLGRPLALKDFTDAPINLHHPLWMRLCTTTPATTTTGHSTPSTTTTNKGTGK